MGALKLPQIHLRTAQNSGFFYVKQREKGGARGMWHLGTNGDLKKNAKFQKNLFVPGPVIAADLSPILRLLQIFAKKLKSQAEFFYVAGAVCLKAMVERQARVKMGSERVSISPYNTYVH